MPSQANIRSNALKRGICRMTGPSAWPVFVGHRLYSAERGATLAIANTLLESVMLTATRRCQKGVALAKLLLLGTVAACSAASAASIAAPNPAVDAPEPDTLIIGKPLPIDLYPANCTVSAEAELQRAPVLQSNIFLLDRRKSGEEQFVAATASVWRAPCNRERSVLLLQIDVPPGSSARLELPTLQIVQSCPAFLDGGFAVRLDDYSTRTRFLEPATDTTSVASHKFSLAALGLDRERRPIDVLPLAECDINQPITLRFRATTDPTTVLTGNGAQIVPGVSRTDSVAVAAFDPTLYPETMLKDLLTGHVSGAYFDPNFPGEGIQVEISPVPGGQVFVLTWFTFDDAGNPFWLVGTQSIEPGQRSVDLVLATRFGGSFAAVAGSSVPQALTWGNLSLAFDLCNTLDFSFESTHNLASMPRGSGQRSWVRLTEISGLGCD